MRRVAGIVLTAALLTGTAACGDDGPQDESNGQAATEFGNLKPEDVRAAPAEVADGFRLLDDFVDDVVAKLGTDAAATTEAQERVLTIWESILGAVKANDEAAYSKLNDALTLLMGVKDADEKAKAQEAADTVSETADAYLERFPGSGSPQTSGSPSPSAGSSSEDSDSDVDSDIEPAADPPISY